MLAHLFAVAVGLGSIILYLAAFFFPEIHRKHDFFWSGVGCFYGLILWVDAEQISQTELLSHAASIALIGWFAWNTLTLRRKRTPRDLQTPLTDKSWQVFRQELTSLGASWLRRTPLGKILGKPEKPQDKPLAEGGFRASSLKQVDYEFVEDLPPHHGSLQQSKPLPPKASQPLANSQPATAAPGQDPPSRRKDPGKSPAHGPQAAKKPLTPLEKAIVIKDWLVEIATSMTRPKPAKPVIEIPPREPRVADRSQPQRASEADAQVISSKTSVLSAAEEAAATTPAAYPVQGNDSGDDGAPTSNDQGELKDNSPTPQAENSPTETSSDDVTDTQIKGPAVDQLVVEPALTDASSDHGNGNEQPDPPSVEAPPVDDTPDDSEAVNPSS